MARSNSESAAGSGIQNDVIGKLTKETEGVEVIVGRPFQRRRPRFAEVDADRDRRPASARVQFAQLPGDRIRPFVIESEAIDQRRLLRESKNARLRISGLRFGGHSADLNETKTERGQRGQGNAVLIETGGQSDRISKGQAENCFWFRQRFKKLQCAQGQIDLGSAAQDCDREMMRRFRIYRKKKRPNESLVGIHHFGRQPSRLSWQTGFQPVDEKSWAADRPEARLP